MHWNLYWIPLYPFYLGVDGMDKKESRCQNSSVQSDPDDLASGAPGAVDETMANV